MDSGYPRHSRNKRSRDSLDRRMDQWIETGRQFVDGVSGTRPGKRKNIDSNLLGKPGFEKVGRWVEDKLDWLLEDDEDFVEPWESDSREVRKSRSKRPLDAISRRVSHKRMASVSIDPKDSDLIDNDWPDDESFRVNRWQRSQLDQSIGFNTQTRNRRENISAKGRSMPRSSRKRV